MDVTGLTIPHSYVVTPKVHSDDRGDFWEWYKFDQLSEHVGHPLSLRQANASVSKRGVFRGIHFAELHPGQAKYVTCPFGEVLDIVVDIRVGSPTFGQVETVLLNDKNRKAVYLAEGLGHGFIAFKDNSVVNYLVSGVYNPEREHGVNPFDPVLGLTDIEGIEISLSPKDAEAPSLHEAMKIGLLPTWEESLARYEQLSIERGSL
ncbi:dTDP-4-dehydrorhamnose 3,5-epimerase family protein [Aurantimicrobium minutum]|uniref:dTDP-4-dehydrorhamnose 3,5-epimerase family protein n=1 Tax=Aurantimicrobium minutum TaxID=708131 RepID=UPI002475453A|nr:dTDP-4-dehydrorhamnose 3,5-epimerase [Aurantimicrobium minutum]MDH6423799.1 dTDP-4-dehydrorhamnose 3,5-epimerase [Aurantimicrobium minutum]